MDEKLTRRLVQILLEIGRLAVDALIGRILRIEDAQRVAFETPATVLRQLGNSSREVIDERSAIGGAAFRIPQSVEFEDDAVGNTKPLQDAMAEGDHLDIGLRLRHPQQLDPDLVELPEAALLRPLVAEHRARIEEFERRRLGEPI